MPAITARFYVAQTTRHAKATNAGIVLMPAYANGANAAWASATPSGKIELQVSNPDAVAEFNRWLDEGLDIHITMEPVSQE